MKLQLCALFIGVSISCGVARPKDVDPDKLVPAAEAGGLRLDRAFTYEYTSYRVLRQFVLTPGVYRPEFSSKQGVYYRGPSHAVEMVLTFDNAYEKNHVERMPRLEGGVFVDRSGAALIYYYVQAAQAPARSAQEPGGGAIPNLVDSYLASRNGKITFARKMRPSMDLARQLRPESPPGGAAP